MTQPGAADVKSVPLPGGERVAALGLGTWNIGESRSTRAQEIATLREGIDLGLTLIDTAEMYGSGRSEDLVGEAIAGRRDEVFLVSKVLPENASHAGTIAACERSLRHLRTDRIDLYLLHWRGSVPLAETVSAFADLQKQGKIRYWGVSNFDTSDMTELWSVPQGTECATNQVLYNLARRGIEWDLLPWMREQEVPVMAYSPIEQGRLLRHPALKEFARKHSMTPAQAALAWLLTRDDVIAIPKTGNRERLKENHGALAVRLSKEQLDELDAAFPPPDAPSPLAML